MVPLKPLRLRSTLNYKNFRHCYYSAVLPMVLSSQSGNLSENLVKNADLIIWPEIFIRKLRFSENVRFGPKTWFFPKIWFGLKILFENSDSPKMLDLVRKYDFYPKIWFGPKLLSENSDSPKMSDLVRKYNLIREYDLVRKCDSHGKF